MVGRSLFSGQPACFDALVYPVPEGDCHRGCSLGLLYRATVLFLSFPFLFSLSFSFLTFLFSFYMTKEKTSIRGVHQEH